jgi:hypothetical protein
MASGQTKISPELRQLQKKTYKVWEDLVGLVHIRQPIILALYTGSSLGSFIVALLKNKIDRFAVKESKSQID